MLKLILLFFFPIHLGKVFVLAFYLQNLTLLLADLIEAHWAMLPLNAGCVLSHQPVLSKHKTNWCNVYFQTRLCTSSGFLLAKHLGPESHWGANMDMWGGSTHMSFCTTWSTACQIPDVPHPPQASFVTTTHAFTGISDVLMAIAKLIFQIWNDTTFSARYIFQGCEFKGTELCWRLFVSTV